MSATTIKVPTELRDRLAGVARRNGTTLAGAISTALDVAEDAQFWSEVTRTMAEPSSRRQLTSDVDALAGSLTDGLDPEESWDDVW